MRQSGMVMHTCNLSSHKSEVGELMQSYIGFLGPLEEHGET